MHACLHTQLKSGAYHYIYSWSSAKILMSLGVENMAHQVQTKNNRRKHHVVATRTDSSIGAIGHFTPYMRAARSSALLSFTCRHGISALFLVSQFFFSFRALGLLFYTTRSKFGSFGPTIADQFISDSARETARPQGKGIRHWQQ